MALRALIALTAVTAVAAGIYPDGHFDVSTKLTVDNFDQTIKDNIDAGKTMFAPAWNAIVQEFKDDANVAFGDVLLSEQQIRGNHNPGAGGWPTIRYFNADTGVDGAAYPKKTDKAMCDELGDETYMRAYVEEMSIKPCQIGSGDGCSEKENAYIEKTRGKALSATDLQAQVDRLEGMKGEKMKPELSQWIGQRINILKQLQGEHDEL